MGLADLVKIFKNCIKKNSYPVIYKPKAFEHRLFSANIDAQHMVKNKDQSQ